jgi:hypothetical protein
MVEASEQLSHIRSEHTFYENDFSASKPQIISVAEITAAPLIVEEQVDHVEHDDSPPESPDRRIDKNYETLSYEKHDARRVTSK